LKRRIAWVDALKVFGIVSVVLGHFASPLGPFIYSFHMPLFFIISGFFMKADKAFKLFAMKNLRKLMLPYLIFAIIGLGIEIIKRELLHRPHLDYVPKLIDILLKMDMDALMHTYGLVLWFLPALFWGRLFLFLLLKYVKNDLLIFFVGVGLLVFSLSVDLPFGIDDGMNAVFWLCCGNIFFRRLKNLPALSLFLPLMLGLAVSFPIPKANLSTKYYSEPILNILWAFSVIYLFVVFFRNFSYEWSGSEILTKWSESALVLFVFHPYTNNAADLAVEYIGFGDWYLKLLLSVLMLQMLLLVKKFLEDKGVLRVQTL
jgi:acyltransferase